MELCDGPRSIPESLAQTGGGLAFVDETGSTTRFSGRELLAHATAAAANLRRMGVRPHERVCLFAPTSVATLVTLFGLWRLGAVPVVVARPPRAGPDEQRAQLAARVAAAGAVAVVTDPAGREPLAGRLPVPVLTTRDVEQHAGAGAAPAMPGPDQLGLLQFTSGTTGASRAVPVTQGQMVQNVHQVVQAAGLPPGTTHVSWLPLYHDMGIISLAGLISSGRTVVALATETFMRQPAAWMEAVSRFRAESTAAPNFAYGLAARTQRLRPRQLDLSRLTVAFNGAEPVTVEVVEQTLQAFQDCGMRPEAMCPTYGLAEATLGVATTTCHEPVHFAGPEWREVPAGGGRPTRPVASCGRPIPGTRVAIRDGGGADLPEGEVGEVVLRGPGVMPGYWSAPGTEPPRPAPAGGVVDGWLHTGDLGFLRQGQVYVCGRVKDMIIVGGRNLYPEDYEDVVEQVPAVRTGGAIAFSLAESERMVVVAECRGSTGSLGQVGRELQERLRSQLEYAPEEIVLVRPGTLPKTSSGKRQRSRCRELYLAGDLAAVHNER